MCIPAKFLLNGSVDSISRGKLDNTINFAAHAKFVDNWLRHLPKVELTTTTPPEVPKKDASNGVEGKAAPEVPAKEDKPSKAVTEAKSAPEVPEKETRPATTEVSATPAIPEKEAPEKASAPVVEKIAEKSKAPGGFGRFGFGSQRSEWFRIYRVCSLIRFHTRILLNCTPGLLLAF